MGIHRRDATSPLWVAVAVADCATHTSHLTLCYPTLMPWLEAWLGFPRAAGPSGHAIVFPRPIPELGGELYSVVTSWHAGRGCHAHGRLSLFALVVTESTYVVRGYSRQGKRASAFCVCLCLAPPFLCNARFFASVSGSEHSRTAFLPRKQRGESRCDKTVVRQTTLWNLRRILRNRNFHMPENARNSFFGAALFSSPLSKYPGISTTKYQSRQLCLSCPIMQISWFPGNHKPLMN